MRMTFNRRNHSYLRGPIRGQRSRGRDAAARICCRLLMLAVVIAGVGGGPLSSEASAADAAATATVSQGAWTRVAAGPTHTCGIRAEGELWCWGDNDLGQLGLGTQGNDPVNSAPQRLGSRSDWDVVAVGFGRSCAVGAGELWCTGAGAEAGSPGEVGGKTSLTRVGSDLGWTDVTVGDLHQCGIKMGALWCWGLNYQGQLGQGDTSARSAPTQVGSRTDWQEVDAQDNGTCGRAGDGAIWCWGDNPQGQLGVGDTSDRATPTRVGTATWSRLAAGGNHACAVKTDEVWCWGYLRDDDNIGVGQEVSQLTPRRENVEVGWSALGVGADHTCAVKLGTMWCWGSALGAQTAGMRGGRTPRPVGTASNWTTVSASGVSDNLLAHTCAIRGGDLWCWGFNNYGQLGVGDTDIRYAPTQVGSGTPPLSEPTLNGVCSMVPNDPDCPNPPAEPTLNGVCSSVPNDPDCPNPPAEPVANGVCSAVPNDPDCTTPPQPVLSDYITAWGLARGYRVTGETVAQTPATRTQRAINEGAVVRNRWKVNSTVVATNTASLKLASAWKGMTLSVESTLVVDGSTFATYTETMGTVAAPVYVSGWTIKKKIPRAGAVLTAPKPTYTAFAKAKACVTRYVWKVGTKIVSTKSTYKLPAKYRGKKVTVRTKVLRGSSLVTSRGQAFGKIR